jgi:FkbM family methyltransferase
MFTRANPWERWKPFNEPERVIDLGANIGLSTLYFAARFPKAQITSVEMMPENAAIIVRSAALNGLDIRVVNVAIGANEGTASVLINKSHTRHSLADLQKNVAENDRWGFTNKTITVPITRLGRLIQDLGWPSVDLMKVDIEGAEKLLLEDIADWAPRVKTVFVEIHHNVNAGDAESILIEQGYKKIGQDCIERTELWFSKDARLS